MHSAVAAIRAGRSRTRFAGPSSHLWQPRLGLRRSSHTPAASMPRGAAAPPPLAAVRRSARRLTTATGATRRMSGLRRQGAISWTLPAGTGRHRARPRSAAPWRG